MLSDIVVTLAIGVGLLLAVTAFVSVVWAVWRMTLAHERIARHVGEIERLLAEHVRGRGN